MSCKAAKIQTKLQKLLTFLSSVSLASYSAAVLLLFDSTLSYFRLTCTVKQPRIQLKLQKLLAPFFIKCFLTRYSILQLYNSFLILLFHQFVKKKKCRLTHTGGFHLHFLVFPFVYQFNSRIGVLLQSSFANDQFRRISTTFQHHFKIFLLWFLHKKECSFYTHLFCCTEMR